MGWLGTGEIIVIFILILIFFGPRSIPEAGRLIGKGLREIRKFSDMASSNLLSVDDEKPAGPPEEIPEKLTPSPDPAAEPPKENGSEES